MADLAAIRVRILRNPQGRASYPDFNKLPSVQASGLDWSKYVDNEGLGWLYDATSSHAEEAPDSPRGEQIGVLVVPEAFALEAVNQFATLVTRITEAELENFHDNRAMVNQPDEVRQEEQLRALDAEMSLLARIEADGGADAQTRARMAQVKNEARQALDPDDPHPGVQRNWRRRWADRKARQGVTILAP